MSTTERQLDNHQIWGFSCKPELISSLRSYTCCHFHIVWYCNEGSEIEGFDHNSMSCGTKTVFWAILWLSLKYALNVSAFLNELNGVRETA